MRWHLLKNKNKNKITLPSSPKWKGFSITRSASAHNRMGAGGGGGNMNGTLEVSIKNPECIVSRLGFIFHVMLNLAHPFPGAGNTDVILSLF